MHREPLYIAMTVGINFRQCISAINKGVFGRNFTIALQANHTTVVGLQILQVPGVAAIAKTNKWIVLLVGCQPPAA